MPRPRRQQRRAAAAAVSDCAGGGDGAQVPRRGGKGRARRSAAGARRGWAGAAPARGRRANGLEWAARGAALSDKCQLRCGVTLLIPFCLFVFNSYSPISVNF